MNPIRFHLMQTSKPLRSPVETEQLNLLLMEFMLEYFYSSTFLLFVLLVCGVS